MSASNVRTDERAKILRKLRGVDITLCYVKRESLSASPWNPSIRTQLRNLTELRESMEQDGFWEFCPILVDRHGVIVDGHCRWTVARELRIDEVPVFIVDLEADELWARYNGTRQEVTGAQALQAVTQGLDTFPPKFAKQLNRLRDVLTQEEFMELGKLGRSPHIINIAIRIQRYLGLEDDQPFLGITTMWLARNPRMSTMVTKAIRDGVDTSILERAIRINRTLETNYG